MIGDGRCFFQSVAIATTLDLQNAERTEHGHPVSFFIGVRERALADSLRSEVIASMVLRQNEIMAYLENDPVALNADMGPNHTDPFSNFEVRLAHMSSTTASVGELEIDNTAKHIRKTIFVLNESFETIRVYNDVFDRLETSCIFVRYSNIGKDIGHYEPVISVSDPDQQQDHVGEIPNPLGLPTPQKVTTQKRSSRCQQPEIITSSPYKKKLSEKQNTAKTKPNKKHTPRIRAVKAKQTGSTQRKSEDIESWYCFVCGEERKESMVQCTKCTSWVHQKCADSSRIDNYICDLCQ